MKRDKILNVLKLLGITVITTSCSTLPKSILLGAGIGGAAGAGGGYGIGYVSDQTVQSTLTGTLVGAGIGLVLGGVGGAIFHKEPESKPIVTRSPRPPSLLDPKVQSVWVPDHIEGNRFVEGHYIYIIENTGNWRLAE